MENILRIRVYSKVLKRMNRNYVFSFNYIFYFKVTRLKLVVFQAEIINSHFFLEGSLYMIYI